jgi:hypothetical protein
MSSLEEQYPLLVADAAKNPESARLLRLHATLDAALGGTSDATPPISTTPTTIPE